MTSSLSIALRSALSGLQVNQTALATTSNNISNANTEGYSRKITKLETVLVAGQGGGVKVADIAGEVSDFLLRDLRSQYSALGESTVLETFYSNMQDMFGQPDSSSSISATISEFANRLLALSVDPESANVQQDAVSAALAVTRQINQMAANAQNLRLEANMQIDVQVRRANALIANIGELNTEIARSVALDRPIGDLADERERAVSELAKIMDISTFTRDSGEMVIFAANGRTLVDTTAATLAYTPAANMSASVTYPGGGLSGITLNGVDVTPDFKSGEIKALIDLRDSLLPDLGVQLDTMATVMRDQLDAIHNDGAAVPPPNTVTGTRSFAAPGTDTVNLSGITRIAVVDASTNIVASIDLDFADLAVVVGGIPTVNEIRDAINGVFAASAPPIPGLVGSATASVNASGQLVITADAGANGIAINERTGQEAVTGFGFSHYFGLNNLFEGDASNGLASAITVRSDIATDPQRLVRGQLSEAVLTPGDTGVPIGDNSVVQRMFNKFQENVTFAQAGVIPQTVSSIAGYGATILATNANAAAAAASDLSFREVIFDDIKAKSDSVSGVNLDEELGNLILFQNAYAANARMVSTISEILEILTELV